MADLSIPQKHCTKCKEWFPATREYFSANKQRRDGFHAWCKSCVRDYQRLRFATPEHKERERIRGKKRHADPDYREIFNQKQRDRYALNADVRHRHYQRLNKLRQDPEYRAKEALQNRERQQKPDVRERRKRQYHEQMQDPEFRKHEKERNDKRRQTEQSRAVSKASKQRRRASEKGAVGHHTAADIRKQYRSQKGKCWHCGKELKGKYHVDHLVPLSRGGSNWPNNLVCSCAKCNLSKNNKLPQEWNGRLF